MARAQAKGSATGGIFICYRHDDSRHAAGRLYDALLKHYPPADVFIDFEAIEPGLSFRKVIRDRIANAAALFVVIGRDWLGAAQSGRRVDSPDDPVRVEIEEAFTAGIRVVPLLIDGAAMPAASNLPDSLKPLEELHGIVLTHDRFQRDVDLLIESLGKVLASRPSEETQDADTTRWSVLPE